MISLEICRLLADEESPTLKVRGMVMIDSVFPQPTRDPRVKVKPFMDFAVGSQPAVRAKVERCMETSRSMIRTWDIPSWKKGITDLSSSGLQLGFSRPPRTVLLRARDPIPVGFSDQKEGLVCETDLSRQHERLGWEEFEECEGKFIVSVRPINGHHFSIFEEENVSSPDLGGALYVGLVINLALDIVGRSSVKLSLQHLRSYVFLATAGSWEVN